MNITQKKVFDLFDDMNILFEVIKHPAVYTIEDTDNLNINNKNEVLKNLFLCDDKKKRYLLIALSSNKKVNLKEIRKNLNCRPISFASEEDLNKYLNLNKGSVTPLGIITDSKCKVEVV